MSETEQDQVINIGDPMPRLSSVAHHGAYEIVVGWTAGTPREHNADLVDLAPIILTHKFYKPLRDNPDLLKTVHLVEDGSAIAWGDDEAIDMAATSIERLAEEQMSSADFRDWLERHKLTYDAAAAQLGISRRLVAYYADQRPVPRYIGLACAYLDREVEPKPSREELVASTAATGEVPSMFERERNISALDLRAARALGEQAQALADNLAEKYGDPVVVVVAEPNEVRSLSRPTTRPPAGRSAQRQKDRDH